MKRDSKKENKQLVSITVRLHFLEQEKSVVHKLEPPTTPAIYLLYSQPVKEIWETSIQKV